MGIKVLVKLKKLVDIFGEICLEWFEYIYNYIARKLRIKRERKLLEVYSIKEEYANEEFVKAFIKQRETTIRHNGYMMQLDNNYKSDRKEEIGTVTLKCRGKIIDNAVLIAGAVTGENDRLIYWKLTK